MKLLHILPLLALSALPLDASEDSRTRPGRTAVLPPAAIQAYDYDGERRELVLTLVDGRRVRLFEVPPRAYDELNQARDKTACFNRHLQPNYRGKVQAPVRPERPRSRPHAGMCTRGLYLRAYHR